MTPPRIDPERAAAEAIRLYDTDNDSSLNAAEVAKSSKGALGKVNKAVLQQKIAAKRAANAVGTNRTVKMRALNDAQLTELGAKVAKHFEAVCKEAKWSHTTLEEAQAAVAKDEALAAAFTLGALIALRAAAGMKADLLL